MTRLSKREFNAMNHPLRRLAQRAIEFPQFKHMGLNESNRDILEIGCGSGYGATLLSTLQPRSYLGIDLMSEQITLALNLNLPGAEFRVQDATDLKDIPDASKDIIVIFGILHHIPEWRKALAECARVLRKDGKIFIEEPDDALLYPWDNLFGWGHPHANLTLHNLENELEKRGFKILKKRWLFGFGIYAAQKTI